MPARVHAFLVVRSDADLWHVERTLRALDVQERTPDATTVVVCGPAPAELDVLIASSGAEGVIGASRGTGFAEALRLASHRAGDSEAVWLLAQDTAPDPSALRLLAGALELQASAAIAAPKLLEWNDPERIVSLGVSMTRFGRAVEIVDGQLDQGQHDLAEDALAGDIRGSLVRREAWDALHGLDPALAGADEGLDLGVRARLAGARALLVPAARVSVAGDGVAGPPSGPSASRRRVYASRTAQLHRRLAYAPAAVVPLHWLSIPVLAVLRTVLHLVRKMPGAVLAEWGASATVWVRLAAIARSRSRIRSAAKASGSRIPWSRLAPLRVTRAQLGRRLDGPDGGAEPALVRSDLRFFTGGGAWAVLAAGVLGAVVFVALLAWPTLGGGGLLPMQRGLGALWADAAFGRRALGLDVVGPADPFAAVVAVIGSLTPWNPSQSLVILWMLALPLAALGGWFAATRVTERSGLRIAGAVLWTLAPTFLVALLEGRPAAVLAHLLLPWLVYTASVARRSWATAGAASVLFAAVAACAPSLIPALLLLWVVALVWARSGVARVAWLPVPAVALFAPLVWTRGFGDGDWWGLLADPGAVFAAAQNGADAAGRALLVAGLPVPVLPGWAGMPELATWAWVLGVPLLLCALLALFTTRWIAGIALLAIAITGIATAIGAGLLAVQSAGAVEILLWPGAGLSLAWLGASGAALVALDAVPVRLAALRPIGATLITVGVVVLAVPTLLAPARGEMLLTNGPDSTLPAYVAAAGGSDPDLGTLVLTPLATTALETRLVWGAGETLGGASTISTTREGPTAGDERIASLAADLVSPGAADPAEALAESGIGFVLLAPARGTADGGDALARQAIAAMNARASLETVGDTGRGMLWRVTGEIADRTPETQRVATLARTIGGIQLAVFAVALLLAVPTSASRRIARAHPRVVGARSAAPVRRRRVRAAVIAREAEDDEESLDGIRDEGPEVHDGAWGDEDAVAEQREGAEPRGGAEPRDGAYDERAAADERTDREDER